jgi:hypothetical protein
MHAGYPLVPATVDRWGNNWLTLRREEVNRQLAWYTESAHSNAFLLAANLFGLSAGEKPEGWDADPAQIYLAYGIGGRFSFPNDGNHRIVTPHYSGMIASLAPEAAPEHVDQPQAAGTRISYEHGRITRHESDNGRNRGRKFPEGIMESCAVH